MARKSKAKKNQTAATTSVLATADIQPLDSSDPPALPKDEEEEELERLIFGDLVGFKAGLRAHEESEPESGAENDSVYGGHSTTEGRDLEALGDDELFFVDSGTAVALVRDGDDDVNMAAAVGGDDDDADAPAWEDSDDEKMMVSLASHTRMRKLRDTEVDDHVTGKEYSRRLRRQFERIYPVPDWALPPKSSKRRRHSATPSSDSDMELDDNVPALTAPPLAALLATSTNLTLSKSTSASQNAPKLRPEIIDIARLTDANAAAPSNSSIQCLSFHPTHPLLLTSGLDSTLRLYHIDGKVNPLATSLHIRDTAFQTSLIHPSGTQIIAGGRRRYFHVWNLESGAVERVTRVYGHAEVQRSMERFDLSPDGRHMALIGSKGTVQLLDTTTNQWVATARIEGVVADVSWHTSSEVLTIANTVGEVYEYSLATKSFSSVWRDEGGVSTTCIANSSRFTVVGSASGIVNMYDRRVSFGGNAPGALGTAQDPKPVKTVESLVTSISALEFSRDGQVLCIASKNKKDALRLVHLPSCTIYKNWPTAATPLGKVTAVKWSGSSGGMVLAVGNEAGRVRLFEVRGS